jgi:hypothetical protein
VGAERGVSDAAETVSQADPSDAGVPRRHPTRADGIRHPRKANGERIRWLLRQLLSNGPMPVSIIRQHLANAGLSYESTRNIRIELGIATRRAGNTWTWELAGAGCPGTAPLGRATPEPPE